jgi:hypothetical protein
MTSLGRHWAHNWPSLTFELSLMAVFLWVVWEATRPGYRGGHLVAGVAGFAALMLLIVLLRSLLAGARSQALALEVEEIAEAAEAGHAADVIAPTWRHNWLAVGYAVVLFALVYVLGTVLGCATFVFVFLAIHRPQNMARNLVVAVVVGALVPYLFGGPVGLHLWEGVIPQIIPGWIGGAPPPPL